MSSELLPTEHRASEEGLHVPRWCHSCLQLTDSLEPVNPEERTPRRGSDMVITWLKAAARRNVATQTELLCENAAVQASGCRECNLLALVPMGSSEIMCLPCEQIS